jgi:hypothetical protein
VGNNKNAINTTQLYRWCYQNYVHLSRLPGIYSHNCNAQYNTLGFILRFFQRIISDFFCKDQSQLEREYEYILRPITSGASHPWPFVIFLECCSDPGSPSILRESSSTVVFLHFHTAFSTKKNIRRHELNVIHNMYYRYLIFRKFI